MSSRNKSAITTPLPQETGRLRGNLHSLWRARGKGVVMFCALLHLMSFHKFAISEEYRTQPFDNRFNATDFTRNTELDRVLERLQGAPRIIQLYGVNSYFNSFAYRSDGALWKRPDYWASPLEFLDQRAGDCEDFAIAKYFALRALGIPDDQILIAHVFDLTANASHMILLYGRPGAPDLALDNRTSLILRLGQRGNLVPVYGFNATGAFLLSAAAQPRVRSQRRIPYFHPQWAEILKKMPGKNLVRPRAKGLVPIVKMPPG